MGSEAGGAREGLLGRPVADVREDPEQAAGGVHRASGPWTIRQPGEGLGQGERTPQRPGVRKVGTSSNLTVWPQADSALQGQVEPLLREKSPLGTGRKVLSPSGHPQQR